MKHVLVSGLLLILSLPCAAHAGERGLDSVTERAFELRARHPRDASLWTQGLLVHDGRLYHSGGIYGRSRLVVGPLDRAGPAMTRNLPAAWFAEGIAVHGDELFLLTWHERIAAVYAVSDLAKRRTLHYRGQGWGLTSDGELLIMSNGSSKLAWRDPGDFRVLREVEVRAGGEPVERLNELEWYADLILANVLASDFLLAIDPHSGAVRYRVDLSGLLSAAERRRADVLNGIAWDAQAERLFVTGKHWPWLFEIRILDD